MKGWATVALLVTLGAAPAGGPIRGLRHPAMSPDGARLAFSWHGDLWVCPSGGGAADRVTSDPADDQKPCWSPDGRRLAFSSDVHGTRDVFVVDLETREVRRLTWNSADDDAPAWSPDGAWIAFQSNRDPNLDLPMNDRVFDVWRMPAEGGTAVRVTRFRGENPAWSPDGKWIAYDRYASGYADGEHNVWIVASDGSGLPREIAAGVEDTRRPVFRGRTVYFSHEANGIHTSASRNLWKTKFSGGPLVQVTGHREDHVTWPATSEGAKTLVYERDFDLWAIDVDAPHPRRLEITTDVAFDDPALPQTFRAGFRSPAWSPSGQLIAFCCRGDVWVVPATGGAARQVTSGLDDDRDPSWSPDEKSLLFVSGPPGQAGRVLRFDVLTGGVAPVPGVEVGASRPRVSPDGFSIVWTRVTGSERDVWISRDGKGRPLAERKGVDEDWAAFSPDGARVALLSEREGQAEVRTLDSATGKEAWSEPAGRWATGLAWSPDGKMIAWMTSEEGGGALKLRPAEEGPVRTLRRVGANAVSWSPDGTMLLVDVTPRNGSGPDRQVLRVYDARKPDSDLLIEAACTRPVTRREEMTGLFLEVWGSYDRAFYDPFFHGVDWPAVREKYRPFAEACRTKPEAYDLINDMIRELRASHVALKPPPAVVQVESGSLGADLVPQADGTLLLRHVEPGGPADAAGFRDGDVLVRVADAALKPGVDLDRLLVAGTAVLTVRGATGEERVATVKAIDRAALRELKYANRVRTRKERVAALSQGRLAYHHIRMMNTPEVQRLAKAIESEFPEAEGLVVDERDGVGGLAHRPLCELLDSTSPERLNAAPACHMRNRNGTSQPDVYARGRSVGRKWDRPVILIQNEISRSDKEIFPYTFRHLGIGYLVGMPTAGGVIGGSDWTMRDGSKITVSMQGWFTAEGRNLEGWGVPPDFRVLETHEDLSAGRDAQLEKAVDVLLAQMDGKIPAPRKGGTAK